MRWNPQTTGWRLAMEVEEERVWDKAPTRSQSTVGRPEWVVCSARMGKGEEGSRTTWQGRDGQRGLNRALGDVKPSGLIIPKGTQE